MRFKTTDIICAECGFTVRVRTRVPPHKEHHAIFTRQAIDPEHCLRCRQVRQVKNCPCSMCVSPRLTEHYEKKEFSKASKFTR